MKAFSIIGGMISPNAVVVAETPDQARTIYNDWLELTYGRRDKGIGVDEIQPGHVAVYGHGCFIYPPGVKGHQDPKFVPQSFANRQDALDAARSLISKDKS